MSTSSWWSGRPLGWLSERGMQGERVREDFRSPAEPVVELDDILRDALSDLLSADSAGAALEEWLRAFLDHARVNQGLGGALMLEELEATGALGSDCHQRILDAAGALLTRAQDSGAARRDLSPADLLQLVVGIALSTTHKQASAAGDPEQPGRLLDLVLDATQPR